MTFIATIGRTLRPSAWLAGIMLATTASMAISLPAAAAAAGAAAAPGPALDAGVALKLAFMKDLRAAAAAALKTTTLIEGIDDDHLDNPWGAFDNFTDSAVLRCVGTLAPSWSTRLPGFDADIREQCRSMQQSLRSER